MSRATRRHGGWALATITRMQTGAADALGRVMWDAIHRGPTAYTAAQRTAWLAHPPQGGVWAAKLAAQQVWVAQGAKGLVGFITLADPGYVDLAYVAPQAQGTGVFSALLTALEHTARKEGTPRLWTHASLMAQPAFAARGFHVIAHETVTRSGQQLARAQMEKMLT